MQEVRNVDSVNQTFQICERVARFVQLKEGFSLWSKMGNCASSHSGDPEIRVRYRPSGFKNLFRVRQIVGTIHISLEQPWKFKVNGVQKLPVAKQLATELEMEFSFEIRLEMSR